MIETVLFALAAVLAAIALCWLPRGLFGPDVSLLNPVRRACLPVLDRAFSTWGGYAETEVSEPEYVGTHTGGLDALEDALYAAGYVRYPLSSLASTNDGRTEIGSWARHDHFWDDRQVHVRIYDAKPDIGESDQSAFDVYAHAEYTAHNPWYARKHYRGIGMSPEEGVTKAGSDLQMQGIDLVRETGEGDPFEPPFRADDTEVIDYLEDEGEI